MRIAIIEKGFVVNVILADEAPNGVASDEANIGDAYDGKSFTPPMLPAVDPWPALEAQAQALFEKTDMVARRCFKDGINYPQTWRDTDTELRAFVKAKDSTKSLPKLPSSVDETGEVTIDYPVND